MKKSFYYKQILLYIYHGYNTAVAMKYIYKFCLQFNKLAASFSANHSQDLEFPTFTQYHSCKVIHREIRLACCNVAILLQVRHVFNWYVIVEGKHSNGIGIMVAVVVVVAVVTTVTT